MMEICSTRPKHIKSAAANGATAPFRAMVHTSNLVRTGIIPTKKVYVSHLLFRNFIDSMTVEVRKRGLILKTVLSHHLPHLGFDFIKSRFKIRRQPAVYFPAALASSPAITTLSFAGSTILRKAALTCASVAAFNFSSNAWLHA